MKTRIQVLIFINENPGIKLKELCKRCFLSKSNLTFHLKILEEGKLVEKLMFLDSKEVRIHPTKKGKDVYLKIKLDLLVKSSVKFCEKIGMSN